MIKYPYPEEESENIRDVMRYFAECYEQKNGSQLPNNYWSRMGGYITRLKSQHSLTLEDLTLLVFGVFNTKPEVKSIGYIQYFIDNLDDYKELRKQYFEQKDKQAEIPEYHEIKQEKGESPLDEFL